MCNPPLMEVLSLNESFTESEYTRIQRVDAPPFCRKALFHYKFAIPVATRVWLFYARALGGENLWASFATMKWPDAVRRSLLYSS